jgi:hypothetical protein
MKKTIFLLAGLVLAGAASAERTVVIHETFGTTTTENVPVTEADKLHTWATPGIEIVGDVDDVVMKKTYFSNKAQTKNMNTPHKKTTGYPFASGLFNVYMGDKQAELELRKISTQGYSDLQLEFGYFNNGNKDDRLGNIKFEVLYSTDQGKKWASLYKNNLTDSVAWFLTPAIALPADANNQADLYIKIKRRGANVFRVDDVRITGEKD